MRSFLRRRARLAHDRLMRPTPTITVLPPAVLTGMGAGLLSMFVLIPGAGKFEWGGELLASLLIGACVGLLAVFALRKSYGLNRGRG